MPRKKEIPIVKKPPKEAIRDWLKNDATSWFLNRLALYLNSLDTIRDITAENLNTALARKMALEIIENALSDILEATELRDLQMRLAKEEQNIIKTLQQLKSEY